MNALGSVSIRVLLTVIAVLALLTPSVAQDYLYRIGHPSFATPESVDRGSINLANGNLHLSIELGSFPQRGKIPYSARLLYDSRIWRVVNGAWQPTNVENSWSGWRFSATADRGQVAYKEVATSCGTGLFIRTYSDFVWTSPDGTKRFFALQTTKNECTGTGTATGSAMADDSSGYRMAIANYTEAEIRNRVGAKMYQIFSERVVDTNGNYIQTPSSGGDRSDTLDRKPVVRVVSGNQTHYDETVREALFKRIKANVGDHGKKDDIVKDVDTLFEIIGDINMREDEMFSVDGVPHVIDFKSGFGSNEKGNMLRLQTVGRAYRIWDNKTRLLLLVRQEENNNYLRVLRRLGLWEVYTGVQAYERISELTGADLQAIRTEVIDWQADLSDNLYTHLKGPPTDLTGYLVW